MKNKNIEPVIFVTGIGQTWSTLKGSTGERWNLVPSSKEVMFKNFDIKQYFNLGKLGAETLLSVACKNNRINEFLLSDIFKSLFSSCIVDENGKLPSDVDVRIYGARSFDKLKVTDFGTGGQCGEDGDSLLKRLYKDIPCQELAEKIGEENLYCFNYSAFSDLYDDAQALHKMIEEVIEDQKNKTGSKKVVLVPMSMGATVVEAYLDKYYTEDGPVGENYISKIIGIVGAWNGSDALADLLTFNIADDFAERLKKLTGDKVSNILSKIPESKLISIAETYFEGIINNVILNTTSFMALVPKERYNEVCDKLFSGILSPSKQALKEKSAVYHNAQLNLVNKLKMLKEKCGADSYFICGYNLKFGQKSRDFNFLSLFKSADSCNTDDVIQISSTAPGAEYVPCGSQFDKEESEYLSPDKTVDLSSSPFRDRIWLFEGQDHELGCNNNALNIAGDIALGLVDTVKDKYPQFNKSRNIKNVKQLIEKAKMICDSGKLPESKFLSLSVAAEQAELMLSNIINDPERDEKVINTLSEELNTVLY